jgi:hypothetical protein
MTTMLPASIGRSISIENDATDLAVPADEPPRA